MGSAGEVVWGSSIYQGNYGKPIYFPNGHLCEGGKSRVGVSRQVCIGLGPVLLLFLGRENEAGAQM